MLLCWLNNFFFHGAASNKYSLALTNYVHYGLLTKSGFAFGYLCNTYYDM